MPEAMRERLQRIVVHSLEDTDNRDGWCRWRTDLRYDDLLQLGYVERSETWKDVLLRPTDAGLAFLTDAHPSAVDEAKAESEAHKPNTPSPTEAPQ